MKNKGSLLAALVLATGTSAHAGLSCRHQDVTNLEIGTSADKGCFVSASTPSGLSFVTTLKAEAAGQSSPAQFDCERKQGAQGTIVHAHLESQPHPDLAMPLELDVTISGNKDDLQVSVYWIPYFGWTYTGFTCVETSN